MRRTLRAVLSGGSFGEREVEALTISGEAVREVLREDLQAIADSFGEEVLVDGVPYRLHEPGRDTYHGLCGPLEIRRPTHRQVGVRNGPIVVAVELAAGLVEGATPALVYNVAHGYARHDMRAHKENLEAAHRVPPSRTTLERIATRLGGAAVDGAKKIEPVVRRAERVPEGIVAVSIGLDRTSVPMMEDRPADAPPKPERKRLRPASAACACPLRRPLAYGIRRHRELRGRPGRVAAHRALRCRGLRRPPPARAQGSTRPARASPRPRAGRADDGRRALCPQATAGPEDGHRGRTGRTRCGTAPAKASRRCAARAC